MEGGRQALERKTVERNRRLLIKGLLDQLFSLIPQTHTSGSKDVLTQRVLLEEAVSYIKQLKEHIETLKRRRNVLGMNMQGIHMDVVVDDHKNNVIQVQVRVIRDAFMVVNLLSGLNKGLKLHHVISILEQEGAEVINASFYTAGDKIMHIIHSQAISSRIGLEEMRIKERLEEYLYFVFMPNESSNYEDQENKNIYLDVQLYYDS